MVTIVHVLTVRAGFLAGFLLLQCLVANSREISPTHEPGLRMQLLFSMGLLQLTIADLSQIIYFRRTNLPAQLPLSFSLYIRSQLSRIATSNSVCMTSYADQPAGSNVSIIPTANRTIIYLRTVFLEQSLLASILLF
jgi:hypothetical protein